MLKVLKNLDEKPSVPWALFSLNLRTALEISYSLINSSHGLVDLVQFIL